MSSTSSRERYEFWQQHMVAWQGSGLSGAAFCKQHELNYAQFNYWRKKLLASAPDSRPAGFTRVTQLATSSAQDGLDIAFARRYAPVRHYRGQLGCRCGDTAAVVMKVRYLRPAKQMPEIYLYRAPVDFRKQANGLALLVEQELGHNPFSGALYAFTNRQRNKIKCVMWEDNGFVMYYKALAEEKFKWPKPADELLSLTGEQINWLLDGYDISLFKGHKKLQYDSLG